MRYKKNGPPIREVIIPIGISMGGNSPLAITSEAIKNVAPTRDESIISFLWSLPTKVLHICGTTSPINPIAPVIATRADVRSVASTKIIALIRLTLMPRIMALSSPILLQESQTEIIKLPIWLRPNCLWSKTMLI